MMNAAALREIIAAANARRRETMARRRTVAHVDRPKPGTGESITRELRPVRSLRPSWRERGIMATRGDAPGLSGIEGTAAILGAGTLTNLAAGSSSTGGGWSWLTDLVKGGAQAWGAAKIEQMRQKNLIETYGTNRTIQAMSALDYQRALEARQRGLELDRSLGVTSPLMTGATPWILGGVAILGLVLLARKK